MKRQIEAYLRARDVQYFRGHHDDDDAPAVWSGTVDLVHANRSIAPAKRR